MHCVSKMPHFTAFILTEASCSFDLLASLCSRARSPELCQALQSGTKRLNISPGNSDKLDLKGDTPLIKIKIKLNKMDKLVEQALNVSYKYIYIYIYLLLLKKKKHYSYFELATSW